MRPQVGDEGTLMRASGTLALVAALSLLGTAWLAVPELGAPTDDGAGEAGTGPLPPAADGRRTSGVNPAGGAGPAAGATEAAAVDPDAPARWPDHHVVVAGESLAGIADRYGLAPLALARANALDDAAVLHPGDVLHLPDPARPRPRSVRGAVAEAPELAQLLQETAEAFGWRPETVQAVAWVESRWDHGRVSHEGAIGIMQVRPQTVEVVAADLDRALNPHALEDNVLAGVAYLDRLAARYDGDLRRTLAAYVQGPTRLDAEGPVQAAEQYVERVLRTQDTFAEAAAEMP
jgi:soluble lytic murein transglycosylase-like protein